ncbi:MAG: nucleotidyltransferase domain-containing protein [Proteobacteria bacterium]|nr:nucleotidyltransferase domain-containing protein [Pseudomonadota bacterium]
MMQDQIKDLPWNVQQSLNDFVQYAQEICQDKLVAIVLYGSAAEARLRPTSDVNLILVLKSFNIALINPLREKLCLYHSAIGLNVMFILDSEIAIASEAFAVKFTDILHRHLILYGTDPFKNIKISRQATLSRLRQVITNLTLRLRERYALLSLNEEKLLPIIAEFTAPIRACAATILSLEEIHLEHPKEALSLFANKFSDKHWAPVLANMSNARLNQNLNPGEETKTFLGLLEILQTMLHYIQDRK